MRIEITIGDNGRGEEWQEMEIVCPVHGQRSYSVYPLCECPEDAIIGRSLISCSEIASLMKLAYDAGGRGDHFCIEEIRDAS